MLDKRYRVLENNLFQCELCEAYKNNENEIRAHYLENHDINEILSGPGLLEEIKKAISVINEDDSVLYILLAVLSKQSVEIRGRTSSGKGAIADDACSLLPEAWFYKITGTTNRALRYLDDNIRLLYVAERRALKSGGADQESDAEYDVKVMISEGGLDVLTTVKNSETNEFETKRKHIKVDSFLITSTSEYSLEEYDNRLHILNTREGSTQNRDVVHSVLDDASKLKSERFDASQQKYKIRKLIEQVDSKAPRNVVIPFSKDMEESFDYSKDHIRRNIKKLLALIEASARLHYIQRPVIDDSTAKILVALPEDLLAVLQIGERTLESTFNVMTKAQIETWNYALDLTNKDQEITSRSIADIAEISQPAAYARLRALYQKGLLEQIGKLEGSGGRAKGQALDVYLPKKNAKISTVIDKLRDPKAIASYEESVKVFLEKYNQKRGSCLDRETVEIEHENVNSPSKSDSTFLIEKLTEKESIPKTVESLSNDPQPVYSSTKHSPGLYYCSVCDFDYETDFVFNNHHCVEEGKIEQRHDKGIALVEASS